MASSNCGCPPAAPCDNTLLCDPVPPQANSCCCPTKPALSWPVCNVQTCDTGPQCEVDNRSVFFVANNPDGRGLACACSPCLSNLGLSATQKAAIVAVLDGVMRAIVPYEYCCDVGEFQGAIPGHTFATKPQVVPFQQNALGVWVQVAPAAIDPAKPVEWRADPASNCCPDNLHSPFLRGERVNYDVSMGRPHFFTDRDAGMGSAIGMAKVAELFCCTKDAILAST